MGLRPTNCDEKPAGGECRANAVWLRACFSGECPMGLRPTNCDEKPAWGEAIENIGRIEGVFFRGAVRTLNFAPESS